jgi:hypothetical protein
MIRSVKPHCGSSASRLAALDRNRTIILDQSGLVHINTTSTVESALKTVG